MRDSLEFVNVKLDTPDDLFVLRYGQRPEVTVPPGEGLFWAINLSLDNNRI